MRAIIYVANDLLFRLSKHNDYIKDRLLPSLAGPTHPLPDVKDIERHRSHFLLKAPGVSRPNFPDWVCRILMLLREAYLDGSNFHGETIKTYASYVFKDLKFVVVGVEPAINSL